MPFLPQIRSYMYDARPTVLATAAACFEWSVAEHPEMVASPFPMCFTEDALALLLATVGSRFPETGAKGFGPMNRIGFDRVEFDERGSSGATGGTYAPDVAWGADRQSFHMRAEYLRLWSGDIHSHPGGAGRPSSRAGRGLGDLGYVEEVFEQNETMEYFLLPILTGAGTGRVQIHPWVVRRGWVSQPMIADVKICNAWEFPTRIFNPIWEAEVAAEKAARVMRDAGAAPWNAPLTVGLPGSDLPFGPPPQIDLSAIGLERADVDSPVGATPAEVASYDSAAAPAVDAAEAAVPGPVADVAPVATPAGEQVWVWFQVRVPAQTLSGRVFVQGGPQALGAWGPGLELRRLGPTEYGGSCLLPVGEQFDWKLTRGGWETVEKSALGAEIPNRVATVRVGSQLHVEVARWADDRGAMPRSVDRKEWLRRMTGAISHRFHEKTILTIGVGGGSYTVEKLARLLPGHLKNVDPDVVELHNLARTAYSLSDIGLPKVDALRRRIAEINPDIRVSSYPADVLTLSDAELAALFDGVDLVVAGTDRFEAQARVNELALRYRVPAVFVGMNAGAQGGRVLWTIPGETGCHRCLAPERYTLAETARSSKAAATRAETPGPDTVGPDVSLDLVGEVGALPDCAFVDAVALKVIVAVLERGEDSAAGRFYGEMQRRNDVMVRCHPEFAYGEAVWDALLNDLPKEPKDLAAELRREALFSMDSAWMRGAHDPACPVCGPRSVSVPPKEEHAPDSTH